MKSTSLVFLALVVLLTGCKNEDDTKVLDSKYYLVNKRNSGTSVSTFEFQSKTLTQDFYTFASESGAFVVDIKAKGKYAYATTYGQKQQLKKIDLDAGTDVKAVNSHWPGFIELHGNNIVTIGEDNPVPGNSSETFVAIKLYNDELTLLDSLTDEAVSDVLARKVIGNRLFYSVRNGSEYSIHVLDLATKTQLPSIALSMACLEFARISDQKVLVILADKVIILNTESLEITDEWQTPGTLAVFGQAPSVAFDAATNTLYYLKPNAQPAINPYTLNTFNLSTGKSAIAGETNTSISAPIILDQNVNAIVSSSGVYSKTGELLEKFSVPVSLILMAE